MRRIFGASQPGEASLARSDSVHSDEPLDRLASPVLDGHNHNNGTRGSDSARRWFSPSTARSSSHGHSQPQSPDSSAQPRASTDSAAAGSSGSFPDLDRLPFGRTLSPSASSTASLSRVANGDGLQQAGSPATSEAGARASQLNAGKDAMMVELLSGEAIMEAAHYQVLPWDERQAMKKEHAALVTRLTGLRRSVAVEARLRDSAAKLVRFSAPEEAQAPVSATAPPRPRVTRQQAEAQLTVAQQKLNAAEHALTQVSAREAELHAKLLAHTAGVLSLALRNRDSADADSNRSSSAARLSTNSHTFADHHASTSRAATAAADQERVRSLERDLSSETAKASTLEKRLADLERALDQTKQQARAELEGLRSELTRAQQATASTEEAATHRVGELENEVQHLRAELGCATSETDQLRGQLSAAAPSDAHRQDTCVLEQDLEHARGEVKQLNDELEEAQGELQSLKQVFDDRLRAAEETGARRAAEAGASAQNRHRDMTQALGDVLRRHRTRPILGPALREVPPFDDTSDRSDLADYLASTLDDHFDRISTHVSSLSDEISALSHERDSAETELEVLRSQADDAAAGRAALAAQEEDLAASRREHQIAQSELSEARNRLAELEKELDEVTGERAELQQLWQVLPTAADGATTFSVTSLVNRSRALVDEHRSLSARVGEYERGHQATQTASQEADAARIRELEERVELSSQKEVTMLERLNDLTESLEATRAERRKLESRLAPLEAEKARLETELAAARSPPATSKSLPAAPSTPTVGSTAGSGANEGEVQELRDQITDLEEELADSQKREQRMRASLLEELATVQSEVSALKTQLRQAQRKIGGRT